ncbi:hypothetical protein [Streptomyces beijiangensis]|uniref:Uncharacterized protein n=1 Tax=Streptomyces beijiangensis TaxID=163361 RepID=A0A939JJQ1_9ACTN|nr:hypothetical protein [Streptomyces beijiangensis]MBO0513874.1 hypothetical protein [Streptomyces beijiangensis]
MKETEMAMLDVRKFRGRITALAVAGSALLMTGGSALAAGPQDGGAAPGPKEAHVSGDAWVRFGADPDNPMRRFIFDAYGAPYRVVDGKVSFTHLGHGAVRYFHPKSPGSKEGWWGTVKVDYVMTGGPVAVVSGTITDGPDTKGARKSFSVYSDPRGHAFDRMGFSWGVVDARCTQNNAAPAPFNSYVSGRGYTVRSVELPDPGGAVVEEPPVPGCPPENQ